MKVKSFDEWVEELHYADSIMDRLYIEENTDSPIEGIALLFLVRWEMKAIRELLKPVEIDTQVQIGNYRVDFLITIDDKKVVIECDGHQFHEKTKEQAARDKKRDRELQKMGHQVLRYTGSEICVNPYQILKDLDAIYLPSKKVN